MADWKTVRYDPNYPEPLNPEIIPLCDALNDGGFTTTSSCAGHGCWPHVWFEHSTDERIEKLARFAMLVEQGDFRRYFSMWQKEIRADDYAWSVEIHLNDVYADTPFNKKMSEAAFAVNEVAKAVRAFNEENSK